MEWISVKDRMPEEGKDVLVWDGNRGLDSVTYEIASYRIFKNKAVFISGSYSLQNIIYWMHLPNPPMDA